MVDKCQPHENWQTKAKVMIPLNENISCGTCGQARIQIRRQVAQKGLHKSLSSMLSLTSVLNANSTDWKQYVPSLFGSQIKRKPRPHTVTVALSAHIVLLLHKSVELLNTTFSMSFYLFFGSNG